MKINQWPVNKRQRKAIYLIILAAIILVANTLFYKLTTNFQLKSDVDKAQWELSMMEKKANSNLNYWIDLHAKSDLDANSFYQHAVNVEESGTDYYIEKNGQLVYWTNNTINPNRILVNGFYKFPNGWYELIVKDTLGTRFYATVNLKKVYSYQNKYLSNSFNPKLKLDQGWELNLMQDENAFELHSNSGNTIFLHHAVTGKRTGKGFVIFDLIGLGMLLIALFMFCYFMQNKALAMVLFPFVLIVLKALTYLLEFPIALYDTEIFNNTSFSKQTELIGTGELILWVVFYIFIIIFIYASFSNKIKKNPIKKSLLTSIIGANSAAILLCIGLILIEEFVKNAQVALEFSDILEFNVFSLISFLIIGALLTSLFLIEDLIINIIIERKSPFDAVFWGIATLVVLIACLLTKEWIFLTAIAILLVHAWNKKKSGKYNLSSIVITLMIYTAASALIIETEVQEKEWEFRKTHAKKLATERDFIAEKLFNEFSTSLQNDPILMELMNQPWDKREELNEYIKTYYFKSYWDKYEIQITGALPADSMLIQPDDELVHCDSYFNHLIVNQGEEVNKNLFFLKNKQGRASYLAKINAENIGNLYVELDSKLRPEGLGFPELLMDQRLQDKNFITKYDYGRYYKGELVHAYGAYAFPLQLTNDFKTNQEYAKVSLENKKHLIHRYNKDTVLIVSSNDEGWWSWVTSFSYQFCFFGLFAFLFFGGWNLISKGGQIEMDFKDRLQFSMLSILLLSLVMVAIGSMYYLINQNETKNHDAIKEKIESVRIELEHKLGDQAFLSQNEQEYLQYLMIKFSKVFFTDISLYDPQGRLLASSQPRLFAEGLTSTMVNSDAFKKLEYDKKSLFIHREKVGKMSFLSAYVPFLNDDNEVIAILNLPYFSKQTELQGQINKFLVAIINIYVLLIVLSILGTVFIYQRLTRPLRLIKEKIGQIRLGKTNEMIEWKGKDEIGDLVREYNRLIVELSESATLLAQSEREGAWKEMARQVAHEIKNPLTPMKLSIQHLMRIADPNDPDFEEKVKKVSKNLITQIDTLSNIANEFSSFAKLPDPINEKVDIVKLLGSACDLFKDHDKYELKVDLSISSLMITADKDQIMRIFNNILKNAVQSLKEDRKGKIHVNLQVEEGHVIIAFKDNGGGIPDEVKSKIFVPNFTTKTSGSGLGLAMVKSMVENRKGKIWFETELDKGSIFFLKFPIDKGF